MPQPDWGGRASTSMALATGSTETAIPTKGASSHTPQFVGAASMGTPSPEVTSIMSRAVHSPP